MLSLSGCQRAARTQRDEVGVRRDQQEVLRGSLADGPTVVFLPGLGGTTRYWSSRVAALERRYRVVLVDLLGFGDSPRPWARYSVERHVQSLAEVLRPYGRVTLVGHSLGALLSGMCATVLAGLRGAQRNLPLRVGQTWWIGATPRARVSWLIFLWT